jgi:proteasome lid subunit RPN8/RPN11
MAGRDSLRLPKLVGDSLAAIGRIGRARSPREACGLLLPHPDALDRVVIELPNRSLTPDFEYEFKAEDAAIELEAGHRDGWHLIDEVAIWHTHPAGLIGPSDQDVARKIPGVHYLVVALDEDGSNIPTWF